MSREIRNIGFIGLGTMGGAVASRLLGGAWEVTVFDLVPAAMERLREKGAHAARDACAAVAGRQVVMTCLPTPELVEAFWSEQVSALDEDAIAVDLSTIDPATSRRIARRIGDERFAAVTLGKTPALAAKGEIPVFAGGAPATLAALDPVLHRMASTVFDMGSVEGATMFKLISNMVGMTNLALLAEAFLVARQAGIAAEVFSAALKTTGGWSVQADLRLAEMMAGDFSTRFAADLAAKDLRLSVDAAARWGVPTPVAAAGLSVFSLAHAMGRGGQDAAAVVAALGPQMQEQK